MLREQGERSEARGGIEPLEGRDATLELALGEPVRIATVDHGADALVDDDRERGRARHDFGRCAIQSITDVIRSRLRIPQAQL